MKTARGRALVACLLALAAADVARAIPVVRKTPGGPWVQQSGPDFTVPAGQPIEWSIRVCAGADPMVAAVTDFLHSGECEGHDVQVLECPPLTAGSGDVITCDDAAAPAITVPALDVENITLGANECVDVIFRTTVGLLTPPGTRACNIAVYSTDSIDPNGSGQTVPPSGSGCSCVGVGSPIPTDMELTLRDEVEAPPFVAGDSASTVVLEVDGTNHTPRMAEGRFLLPIPVGLEFVETVSCPAGATCGVNAAGQIDVSGLRVPENGTWMASFRLRGTCTGVSQGRICAQGWFEPAEDTSRQLLTRDPEGAADAPTCFKPALPDIVLTKTWRYDDRDASGTANAGDRVRFLITAWNRGVAPARDVVLRDALPIGYDRSATGPEAVTTDPAGNYSAGRGTWTYAELGPGSVVTAWIEATMFVDAVAPNRAQLTTRVLRDCGVQTVLSDDPLTAAAGDATAVGGAGIAAPRILKSETFTDLDGDGAPSAGEPVHVTLTIRNEGPATASGLSVTDALPSCMGDATAVAIDPPAAGNAASTARQVQFTSVGGADGLQPDELVIVGFDSSVVTAASCCNQATLSWTGGSAQSSDVRALAPGDASCLQPAGRSLRFTKSVSFVDHDGDFVPTPGDTLRYAVHVVNDGVSVDDVIVSDEIPSELDVDASSLSASAANPPAVTLAPPPAGLHGAGRIHAEPIDLLPGQDATIFFDAVIKPGVQGEVCNQAALRDDLMTMPRLSEDVTTGGPTCVDVVAPPPPELVVQLTSSGTLDDACAQPGEELDLVLSVSALNGVATAVQAAIDSLSGFAVLNDGGGTPAPGEIDWDLGDVSPGTPVTRTIHVQADCDGLLPPAAAGRASASNAPVARAAALLWTEAVPDVSASVTAVHDDTSGDGVLDAGETVLVTLTLSESGSCDAAGLAARLALDPSLTVVELRDGATEASGVVSWPDVALAAGTSATLQVVLGLSPSAPACPTPSITPTASWPVSPGTPCTETSSWDGGALALPPGPCLPAGSDLLREDGIADLHQGLGDLTTLLNAAGQADSCLPGAVTRIDPARTISVDVGALLDPGIVLPNEAVPVGPGVAGQLVLYEVSDSCDTIHACKVDADGDASNGFESIRISVRPCGP